MWRTVRGGLLMVALAACAAPAAPAAPAPSGGAVPVAALTEPPPRERIVFLKPSQGGNSGALWMGEDEGIFTKHGLDVEVRYVEGSPIVMQAMAAGDGDFASVGTTAAISAAFRGLDTVLVATLQPLLVFSIWGNGLERVADLAGKRIASGRVNTDPDFALRLVFNRHGLRYNEDVRVVTVDAGGDPARIATLQGGSADALIVSAGYTNRLRSLGYTQLLDLTVEKIPYEAATVVTTRSFVAAKAHAVQAFLRGYVEAIAVAKQDRPKMLEIYRQHARLDDYEIPGEWYEAFVERAFPAKPYVSEAGVQTVLDTLALAEPQAATVKPEQYIDNRFVRELDESGFIDQLYAR